MRPVTHHLTKLQEEVERTRGVLGLYSQSINTRPRDMRAVRQSEQVLDAASAV